MAAVTVITEYEFDLLVCNFEKFSRQKSLFVLVELFSLSSKMNLGSRDYVLRRFVIAECCYCACSFAVSTSLAEQCLTRLSAK